jgi:HAD superfamily hydrolase (TIGR01509 family)
LRIPVIFLDDGGVISDNAVRAPQWQRLVGEFFAPILGGSPESWADANRTIIDTILEPSGFARRLQEADSYSDFLVRYRLDWLRSMCAIVGVTMPSDSEALALVERVERWIRPQVDAAIPGAAEAIRTLHARGYRLFTASGESSEDLEDYLTGMGVRDCFERLYGPDLVECFKDGPEYYERIFADAGIAAGDALVVDDNPAPLRWAAEVGAHGVLVDRTDSSSTDAMRLPSVSELPHALSTVYAAGRDLEPAP